MVFRVWGLGCKVQGSEFGVWGAGFGVQGSGFIVDQRFLGARVTLARVCGSGLRGSSHPRSWDAGCRVYPKPQTIR